MVTALAGPEVEVPDFVPDEHAVSSSADAVPTAKIAAVRLRDHFMPYPLWWLCSTPSLECPFNVAPVGALPRSGSITTSLRSRCDVACVTPGSGARCRPPSDAVRPARSTRRAG